MAQQTSLVGSIGVIFQSPNVTKLLESWGVGMDTIKSSPLKAAPNPLETTTPEARAAMAAVINDSYEWFKRVVQERREAAGSRTRRDRRRPGFHGKSGAWAEADR